MIKLADDKSVCNENVYSKIYTEHAPLLRNHLYYKCGDLDEAEDIVQESFIKIWKICREVFGDTITGLIYTIANRLFIDRKRAEKVKLKFEKEQEESIEMEDPHYVFRTQEFKSKLEMAISDLPDGQREAFLMNRIDKLTYKEISARLGISETAVEKRMSKALQKLKENIEEFKN